MIWSVSLNDCRITQLIPVIFLWKLYCSWKGEWEQLKTAKLHLEYQFFEMERIWNCKKIYTESATALNSENTMGLHGAKRKHLTSATNTRSNASINTGILLEKYVGFNIYNLSVNTWNKILYNNTHPWSYDANVTNIYFMVCWFLTSTKSIHVNTVNAV